MSFVESQRKPDDKRARERGSDVTEVSIVRKMKSLEVCSLSVNGISTLEDFGHCQNLQELYIRRNKIVDLAEICHLKKLPKLRVLWLADNPCCDRDKYRLTVLRTLPNLQKLDNTAVTEEELNTAVEEGEELTLTKEAPSPRIPEDPETEKPVSQTQTPAGDGDKGSRLNEVVTLTMEETNKIREQLGLKPLPVDKMTPPKSVATGSTKSRNCHILQAVLLLVRDLDAESLEVVGNAVKNRLESL